MLVLQRNEAQVVLVRDALDRHAPIRPVLRDGDRDGVVGFGLQPIARGLGAVEHTIGQDTRAAARIAIDHDAIRISRRRGNGLWHRAAVEAPIALAEQDALQTAIAAHELELWRQEWTVVRSRRRIHEMDWGNIALTALGRSQPTRAADVQHLD